MGERGRLVPGTLTKAAVDAIVARSELATMSAPSREAILAEAVQMRLASRIYFVHHGETERCAVVLGGVIRAVRTSDDGRELSLLWARPGMIIGLAGVVVPPAPTSVQAVTDCALLELPVRTIRSLAQSDASVSWALATYTTTLLRRSLDELVLYAYGGLRARVERRLLEAACRTPPDGPLVAPLTQEDLAQAAGAARPSVARVLKQLRDEGSIRPMYRGILIVRPESLAHEAHTSAA